ncbi:hypothetical protein DH2020_014987 [Rehmannia glutinosa]|uniref:Glycosyltransferase N-terminal domain-containing protein n=1 Tax=Rehmannia glutinosa TaxID=99300 RepID=A0ABR0X158_REHGL
MPQLLKISPSQMALQSEKPNFVLIPMMAPGHIIPMIDMAKLLAKRGVSVTIIVTPLDAARFGSVINRAVDSGLSIQLLQIRFPCEEAGLPPGCESADSLPSYDLMGNFFAAVNLLQKPIEEMLNELDPNPDCIISDKHIPWTADTCDKFRIPRIIFDGMSCFTQLVTRNLYISKIYQTVQPTELFVVPGLPDKIEFVKIQLPGLFNPGPMDFTDFREQVRETESRAYGVVVNTFEEVENRYVEEFKKLKGGKVWCIGPLSFSSNDNLDRAQRGNRASIDSDQCSKWLDNKKLGSVIYVCLGSLSRLSPAQFIELALGLEESNHPFVLVVKGGLKSGEIEKWIVDDGIEERTKKRGLFIRGWAPQVLILSHVAVGGFLTHCGWNSTLEGISAGLPMITWPMFAEQFLNEKLLVQILEIGVGVGARCVIHLGEEEKPGTKVMRDGIKEAIERVMDKGSKEGFERRKRAKEFGKMAKRAVEEGGSSYFGKLLATRGVIVSIITTPHNATRYKSTVEHAQKDGLRIQMIALEFPGQEAGLPPGCENMDSLISMDWAWEFFQACEMLKGPLEKLIGELDPKPSCVISTNALPWTQQVAEMFKIPRGNKASIDEHYCVSWLDSKEGNSVIYACFGSLCRISAKQIKEIGLGLEASNFAFIWIIRGLDCSAEVEEWLVEEKFEQRVGNRGLIIRGWAPQVLILSHPSVGGFLTHCGWNSTLEGISAGVPMITWPMFAEQFYNEKFIVRVLRIGVSMGVERSKTFVEWDRVKKSIEELMDGGEEGKDRRKGAQNKFEGHTYNNSLPIFILSNPNLIGPLQISVRSNPNLIGQFRNPVRSVDRTGPHVASPMGEKLILSHLFVGGFLTHCGWNSTLEGICAGMPMITWPMFAEQFYNEKLIVDVLGIGVRIGVEGCVNYCGESGDLVKWEQVKNGIEKVMDESEDGIGRRKRGEELAKMANDAVEKGGSSYLNLTMFVRDVIEQVQS